jgi:hypothetical protein
MNKTPPVVVRDDDPTAMSLAAGCVEGAVNFRVASGACERISILPIRPGQSGSRRDLRKPIVNGAPTALRRRLRR